MVKLTKIYTRTGDKGLSSLMAGHRRKKSDVRFEAIGAVDEANSFIGLACSHASSGADLFDADLFDNIQNDMFDIGAMLASVDVSDNPPITSDKVGKLEDLIDGLNSNLPALTSFVLPGGNLAGSSLHVARTAARRAERCVVALAQHERLDENILKYLNRLSDLLFVMARVANRSSSDEKLWKIGGR